MFPWWASRRTEARPMTQSFTFTESEPDGVLPVPWTQTAAFDLLPTDGAVVKKPGQKRRRESELSQGLIISDMLSNAHPASEKESFSDRVMRSTSSVSGRLPLPRAGAVDLYEPVSTDSQQNYNPGVDFSSATHVASAACYRSESQVGPSATSMESATAHAMAEFQAIISNGRTSLTLSQPLNGSENGVTQGYDAFSSLLPSQSSYHHHLQQQVLHSNHRFGPASVTATENHFSSVASNQSTGFEMNLLSAFRGSMPNGYTRSEVDETTWPNLTCQTSSVMSNSSRSLVESTPLGFTEPQSPCNSQGHQDTVLTDYQQAYLHHTERINAIPSSTDPESPDQHSSQVRRSLSYFAHRASGRSLSEGFDPACHIQAAEKHAHIHSDHGESPNHDDDLTYRPSCVDGPLALEFTLGHGHGHLEEAHGQVRLEPTATVMASGVGTVGESFDLNEVPVPVPVPVGLGGDTATPKAARRKYHPKVAKDKRTYKRQAGGKKNGVSSTPLDGFTNMSSLKRRARIISSNRSSQSTHEEESRDARHSEVVYMDIDNLQHTSSSSLAQQHSTVGDSEPCISLRLEKRMAQSPVSPPQHRSAQSSPSNSPPVRRTLFQTATTPPPEVVDEALWPAVVGKLTVDENNQSRDFANLELVGGDPGAGVVAVVRRRGRGKGRKILQAMESNPEGKENVVSEIVSQNGLEIVPYENKSVVPYGGRFVPFRKKKTRAKVVLDEETVRVWKLLMSGTKGARGEAETDAEKELKWDEERRKMQAQVHNFIERMHVVIGDRSFSKWKGSVVDSVVGAFLTQNVNDVLSSSAFMSMRSRFPGRGYQKVSEEAESTCGEEEAGAKSPSVEMQHAPLLVSSPPMLPQSGGIPEPSSPSPSPGTPIQQLSTCPSVVLTDPQESRDGECYGIFAGAAPTDGLLALLQRCQRDCSKTSDLVVTEELSQAGAVSVVVEVTTTKNRQPSHGKYNPKTGLSGLERAKLEEKLVTARKNFDFSALHEKFKPKAYDQEPRLAPPARTEATEDGVDWEAVRQADVAEVADVIKERGLNWVLAGRIKAFLERMHLDYGAVDLEWLRSMSADQTKDFLLSIRGLGLKSVECIRLLTLHHLAFPVDTNVGRICVRLGWVPLEPLPEELQLHLLELYPMQATIQKYLWPRLCKFDHKTLYELHYQMISFGKVFCTKTKPNCNACPMRPECKHFASALSSAKLALPSSELQSSSNSSNSPTFALPPARASTLERISRPVSQYCQPIIEEPMTPEFEDLDIEDFDVEDYPFLVQELIEDSSITLGVCTQGQAPSNTDKVTIHVRSEPAQLFSCCSPLINVTSPGSESVPEPVSVTLPEPVPESGSNVIDIVESTDNLEQVLKTPNVLVASTIASQEMVVVAPEIASLPVPKLKNVGRLRTIHYVYELPDSHPLLQGLDPREGDDPCTYLLAIWGQDEMPESIPNMNDAVNEENGPVASSSSEGEETIKATLLVPCRTAMRGSFPLNGTYFQVNEVFADHASSQQPMLVPRTLLWNLRRRFVFFGTSVSSIFRGMTATEIQACFWRGYVCVRGFDRLTKAPKPLVGRLHLQAAKAKGVNAADG